MAEQTLDRVVKLSGALPREDYENGVDHLSARLAEQPEDSLSVAIVILDVKAVTYNVLQDAHVPMLRIREIEAVPADSATDLVERLRAMRVQRRGAEQDELPPDLDDHLEPSSFDDVNEIHPDTVAIVPGDEDAVVTDIFDPKKRR